MKNKYIILASSILILSLSPNLASANTIQYTSNRHDFLISRENNLIINGDFSHGSEGWDALVDTINQDAIIDYSMGDTATTNSISVEKNSKYRLSFDLKNTQISQLDCNIDVSAGNITQSFSAILDSYDTWKTFSFIFSSYDYSSLKIKFAAINTLSDGVLDNVKLVKIN